MKSLEANHYLLGIELKRSQVKSFDEYPFSLPFLKDLKKLELHPKVTFLVGENGSGKSTILEAIAVAWGFNPEGGTKNFKFQTKESHSALHEYLRLHRGIRKAKDGYFFRAESFFNVATEIERLDDGPGGPPIISSYGGMSLHGQSHGESFLALLMNRFNGNGLYLLDEPEAALSPQRQLAAISRLHQLLKIKSQFIIATHSPILLAYPDSWIYQIDASGIKLTEYKDTEHYLTTKKFITNPENYLNQLLE
ncbi:AAA family ATPase [Xanthomonas sp. CFBP 8703]|uniref:AAA family ATPase n=1 Tax=Xanthomonas bonasiae TaxID=2810351 RepID=A0ABS3AWZ6_9XANT|nr:AAA family ATPase [Xanthomonas bonasiae]MBN6100592.1 AAA family ATPase [Xanthomonas bonasiae]